MAQVLSAQVPFAPDIASCMQNVHCSCTHASAQFVHGIHVPDERVMDTIECAQTSKKPVWDNILSQQQGSSSGHHRTSLFRLLQGACSRPRQVA